MLRHTIYTVSRISIYENLRANKYLYKNINSNNFAYKFIIGGFVGGISQLIDCPYDLLKVRYITNNKNNIQLSIYNTIYSIIKKMVYYVAPIDVIKSRVMKTNSEYTGIINCISKTVQNEGLFNLYKGFCPIWLRLEPRQVIFWTSYEQLRKLQGIKSF